MPVCVQSLAIRTANWSSSRILRCEAVLVGIRMEPDLIL